MADPGVPLAHYRQHGASVRLTCLACMQHHDWPLEAVTERLRARGVGGETTGVREAARHVRSPCGQCGGSRFETAPAFPHGHD